MTDIDWLAVDMVCNGTPLALTKPERMAVMRRLDPRILSHDDEWECEGKQLNMWEVARRLQTTERSVQRMRAALPTATKSRCPVCGETMWVSDGVVEAHPDCLFTECPMSGRRTLSGLAATRPDLYRWMEVS